MFQPAYFHSTDFSLNIDLNFVSTQFEPPQDGTLDSQALVAEVFDLCRGLKSNTFNLSQGIGSPGLLLQLVLRHEQRHFLDHVLTNYGARRVFRNAVLIANLRVLLGLGAKYGNLVAPIDTYGDTIRMEYAYGLSKEDAHHLSFLGKWMIKDREFYITDKKIGQRLSPSCPLDGVAFLEALAEGFECPSQRSASTEFVDQWSKIDQRFKRLRFLRAVVSFIQSRGIELTKNTGGSTLVNGDLLYPVLIASLMTRQAGSPVSSNSNHTSPPDFDYVATLPSLRFDRIVSALSKLRATDVTSTNDGFHLVDSICRSEFDGSSIQEEMSQSIRFGDRLFAQLDDTIASKQFFLDYQVARRAALEEMKSNPSRLMVTFDDKASILNGCVPRFLFRDQNGGTMVAMYSGGSTIETTVKYIEEAHGMRAIRYHSFGGSPLGGVLGIQTFEPQDDELKPEFQGVKFDSAALEELRQLAPTLDLLTNGRLFTLEREQLSSEAIVDLQRHGVAVELDPGFEFPRFNRKEPDVLEYLFTSNVRCGLSDEPLQKNDCILVSSTELREPVVKKRLSDQFTREKCEEVTTRRWGLMAVHQRYLSIFD